MCMTLGPCLLRGRLLVAWWREHGEDNDAVAGRLTEGAHLSACPEAAGLARQWLVRARAVGCRWAGFVGRMREWEGRQLVS